MPARAAKIEIPRWIQLAGLPVLLLFLWIVVAAVRHVVFLFLVAVLIALLLSPLVRGVQRVRLPRGFSVALVYLVFAITVVAVIGALGTVVVSETKTAAKRVDSYFTDVNGQTGKVDADRDVDRLQRWLDDHRLGGVDIQARGHRLVRDIRRHDVGKYTTKVVNFLEGAATLDREAALQRDRRPRRVDLHAARLPASWSGRSNRRFPPEPGSEPLILRMEHSLVSYVKGQSLVSLIIGTSAGVGLVALRRARLASARPEVRAALRRVGCDHRADSVSRSVARRDSAVPLRARRAPGLRDLGVRCCSSAIHQVEGHVVVPKVMGSALRLHPLLVIFGLLAGGEIYGLPGALVALPLLAAGRAMWEFFGERIELEPWEADEPVAVPVELDERSLRRRLPRR